MALNSNQKTFQKSGWIINCYFIFSLVFLMLLSDAYLLGLLFEDQQSMLIQEHVPHEWIAVLVNTFWKNYISQLQAKNKTTIPPHTCFALTTIVYPSNLQTAQNLSSLESDRWERVRECWRETQTMKTGGIRQTKQESRDARWWGGEAMLI